MGVGEGEVDEQVGLGLGEQLRDLQETGRQAIERTAQLGPECARKAGIQ